MTTIHDVIGYVGPGENTDIRRINSIRRVYPRAYGAVLLACARKQVELLFLLWRERFMCPKKLRTVLKKLVDEGNTPRLLILEDESAYLSIEKRYSLLTGVDNEINLS